MMDIILMYINDEYLLCDFYENKITNLNNIFPQLKNIYPKYINSEIYYYHFILDINNNLHILYNTFKLEFYENFLKPIMDNPLIIKSTNLVYCGQFLSSHKLDPFSDACDSNPVISFFHFDNYNNKFILESIEICDVCTKKYDSLIFELQNIQSYNINEQNHIILKCNNDNVYIYEDECATFKLYNVNTHTDNNKHIIHIDINNNIFVDNKKISQIKYIDNNYIVKYVSNYWNTPSELDNIYIICNYKIIRVQPHYDLIYHLDIPTLLLSNQIITHFMNSKFIWTKNTHHYLSYAKKNIIKHIIMYNKHCTFHKIPLCVLSIIFTLI